MGAATSNSRNIDNNQFGDNATINLGDIQNEVNYILQRRETPPQPSQLIPFPRDQDFVNRGDILDQISARCLEPAGRVALVGLGGVGKSQLAIEFAHRFAEEHKNIWLFWIHAATQARVEEGFQLIADAVKLPERKEPRADIPLLVKNWLSIEHNGRWVMILDSADDNDVLYSTNQSGNGKRSLAACIPKTRNGAIVLTTRNRSLASKLIGGYKHIIDVDTMSEADALTLLERKMGSPLPPSEAGLAEDLVKTLECIPLAISQAAAYIQARRPRSSIEKYLVEFRKSERESTKLLKHEANDIGRDEETSNTVLRTWAMSFEHIRSQQRSAADLLSLMSFFDRQGIPGWVLKGSTMRRNSLNGPENSGFQTGEDSDSDVEIGFEEDILTLRNFCLIAVDEEGNRFEMHRLVQLSIKSWLKAFGLKETFMQQYIKRMAVSFPIAEYENWAICQDLFAHVQVALGYQPSADTLNDWATLFYRGGTHAYDQGKYHIAEQMTNESKKASEKIFGKDDRLTLRSMSLLTVIMSDQKRWDEAEKLEMQVLEARKAKFGADDSDTLTSINNLALIYLSQNRWDEAEELNTQVMEARKAKIGADHPDTLTSMNNLAGTYSNQGRWDEAEKLQVQVMEARKAKLGADHPRTLISMYNLAWTWNDQGRHKDALVLLEDCLQARQRVLGLQHPDTLQVMHDVASIYRLQGQWDKVEELVVQIFEARKTALGIDHPQTLSSMNNLAFTWKSQGRHEEALALMKECVESCKRVLGIEHSQTLGSLRHLEEWSKNSD